MKNFLLVSLNALSLSILLLTGCKGFLGTKTETDFLEPPVYLPRQVAYVPLEPAITGLQQPVDIIAGWDDLLYVADAGTEQIIAYDQALVELARFPIPGLTSIAQDRRLDILAIGKLDTVINGIPLTLSTIFRLDLDKEGNYGLANARIKNKIVHPFYFLTNQPTSKEEEVRFTGIAPLANNQFYVSRTGPVNSLSQFGGPDDAVLLFGDDDTYITPVAVNTNLGLFRDYFKEPSGLTTYAQPPQSDFINARGDFIYTSLAPDNALKVQVISRIETPNGAEYRLNLLPIPDTSQADGYLYAPNRFKEPVDVTIAGDETNYIFVLDAGSDSVFQFNALGYEGVEPPPGSSANKAILASFGGTGEGPNQFRDPSGLAYLDRILYVADTGNGRVLRFRLTTDFD